MKTFAKRGLAMVLALILCISLFSGLTASAKTGTLKANTGKRHELCTSLSSQAEVYYTGEYTYDRLSALQGGNESCLDTTGSALFQKLSKLMSDTMTKSVSYKSLEDYWPDTDANAGSSNAVLFYSDTVSSSFNREHVWPKSKASFYQSNGGSDLHHLRPTNTTINSTRGNHTMGNVREKVSGYATEPYNGKDVLYYSSSYKENGCSGLVEVNDNIKGDVARIMLYVYVRWQERNLFENDPNPKQSSGDNGGNNGLKVMESLETLLEWCESDPVDAWEMGRNDQCENVQGNRNVFIDYPEYAWLLFGQDIPNDMPTPSGEAGGSVSYKITAVSNNTNYGTVSLSGRTITAYPKTGYYVAGYSVTSGSAKVTQNGNTFSVSPDSDCTVRINFAAKTTVSVSFYENGTKASTLTGYTGEAITLPVHKNSVPTGYSFIGWMSSQLGETTAKPTYYVPGGSYTPISNSSLYALYTRTEGGTGNTGEFTLFTGGLEEGDYIIVYDGAAMVAADSDENNRLDTTTVTISNDCISQPDDSIVWHIAPADSGYYTIYNTAASAYAGGNGTKNLAVLLDSVTDYAKWTPMEGNGSGTFEFVNVGNKSKGVNANLRRNGSVGFACYSTGTGNSLSLYQGESGTVYYTTYATVCNHNWIAGSVVRPTCTEGGYTPYTCSRCGAIKQENATNPTGHSYSTWVSDKNGNHYKTCSSCGDKVTEKCTYEDVVTPPSETAAGYTTHTCTTCKYSYKDSEVPALGSKLLISFSVPKGVTAPTAQSAYAGSTITLPSPSGKPSEDSHSSSFIGWIAASVDNKTEVGTYYAAGDEYTVTKSATLYALYRYAVGGSGSTEYVLTDISSISATDEVVITMEYNGTVYALPNDSGASTPDATIVSASNGKLTSSPAENLLWNVGGTEGNYIFYPNGSTASWLYCTADNNGVRIGTNSSNTFRIDASTGYLRHNKTNRYVGVFRNNPDWRCYTSSTTNIGNQALGFYAKGAGGTVYYTTVFAAAPCKHSSTNTVTVDATCTKSGSVTVICDDCGEVISVETIPALGHSYSTPKDNGNGTHTATCACGDAATEAHTFTNSSCICGAVEVTGPVVDENIYFGEQLALENDLTMTFRLNPALIAAYDISTLYIEVERDIYGSDGTMEVERRILDTYVDDGRRLVFSLTGIAAAQMNDEIRATLHIKDAEGKEYVSPTLYTSVTIYLRDTLSNMPTGYDKLYTLIMDMLSYGTAAQYYFNRHTDAPALDAYEIFKNYASYASADLSAPLEDMYSIIDNANATGTIGQTLDLGTRIGITYKVALPAGVDANDAFLAIRDADGNLLETLEIAGNSTDSRGRYIVNFYGSTSKDMRRVVYATVYAKGVAVTDTYTYSISTYAYETAHDPYATAETIVLTNAMVIYGDSAVDYFAN